VTEFSLEQLFPPDLENALGRMRHFISYARAAGLVKEDRGVVELTDVGRRYVRAGDSERPFDVSPQQAEWMRRQLREKHMTDSIFHGLAIGLSLLASCAPPSHVSKLDFGRSLAYLGRAGWDNENTFQIQGERYLVLLFDIELIDDDHRLTETGALVRGELTLPVHMGLLDIAAQLNPGGADAVRTEAEAEWSHRDEPAPAAVTERERLPRRRARLVRAVGVERRGRAAGRDGIAPEPPASQVRRRRRTTSGRPPPRGHDQVIPAAQPRSSPSVRPGHPEGTRAGRNDVRRPAGGTDPSCRRSRAAAAAARPRLVRRRRCGRGDVSAAPTRSRHRAATGRRRLAIGKSRGTDGRRRRAAGRRGRGA
jgi:hypothetical protein